MEKINKPINGEIIVKRRADKFEINNRFETRCESWNLSSTEEPELI